MEQKDLISFQNVYYAYEEEAEEPAYALKNVTFSVKEGEFLFILGHNGSGKSTVAKLANGLLLPTSGVVTVDGADTKDENAQMDVRKKVGVVFQNPDNQIVASIVEEDVAFGPENLCLPREEIRARVDEALRSVDMTEKRHAETYRLSGGQKQRVAIAGVIAMRPKCIVFDEPTAMLDPKGRRAVLHTIRDLNTRFGITVILITHFMEEAAQADRILVLNDAEIALEGRPREVFSEYELLLSCGLELPDTAKLGKALQESGVPFPDGILSPDEFLEAYMRLRKDH